MAAHRPMTAAEKYYTFLDHRWRVNVLISADLDVCFDPAVVRDRWLEFRARRVLARAVPTVDLTLVDLGPDVAQHGDLFRAVEMPSSEWDGVLDEEAEAPYDLDLPMRLRYLTSPAEGRSRVLIVGHHSMLDGRIGLAEMQAFVRFLDGQDVAEQHELSVPAAPATGHAWQQDARARLALLRAMRNRSLELGTPGPDDWPAEDVERIPRLRQALLESEDVAPVIAEGRRHGVSVFSVVAAAWLATVARHLGMGSTATDPVLQLAVPADTSTPSTDPSRPTAMSVPVITRSFRVPNVADAPRLWELAGEILREVREGLERGEGDLFFQLTRAEAVEDLTEGAALVGAGLAASPPCVLVSNMGVIDPGTDPEWLHHVQGQLATTPNQMVFAAILSYRGRLVQTISTDTGRIPQERAAEMTDSYLELLRALGRGTRP